jgi:hypothetical protein
MVAYLQKQPRMSVDEFRTLTANASAMGGHEGMPASGASTPAPASTAAPASASSTH